MNMKWLRLAGPFLLIVALAGCGSSGDDDTTITGTIDLSFENGAAVLHADGQPDAQITAAGGFSIDGKPVALTAAQRDLFRQYYADAGQIRNQGIATGKAGAALAGHAIGEVVSGLAHGDPDKIGPAIEAKAGTVTAQAARMCDTLDQLRTVQDTLSGQLDAFRPYATLTADKVAQCHKGTDQAARSLAGH